MDRIYGTTLGVNVYCEEGYISNNGAYQYNGTLIKEFEPTGEDTRVNFLNAVRSRDIKSQNAHILDGHLSATLVHMANISYRVGNNLTNDEIRERIRGTTGLQDTFERFDNHLYANRIDLKENPVRLGPMLTFNSSAESFSGDFSDEANRMVKPEYRKQFTIPDKV